MNGARQLRQLRKKHSMRLDQLRQRMKTDNLDILVITKELDMEYLCGIQCSSGMLFVLSEQAVLLTDYRYAAQARDTAPCLTVVDMAEDPVSPYATATRLAALFTNPRIGADAQRDLLGQLAPGAEVVPAGDIIVGMRAVKDQEEIQRIKGACEITGQAYLEMLCWLKPGMTEREVAIRLEHFMKTAGADQPMAYNIVVASGHRSAYAHARATHKVIEASDVVLLDFGCKFEGYCSDLSRTVVMGSASKEQLRVYKTIQNARHACIDLLAPGVDSALIDRTAQQVCADAGYLSQYGRGVGHGVGLSVAEAPVMLDAPGFAASAPIPRNAVVTIEPAIYLEGFFGMRLEDVFLVTDHGAQQLGDTHGDLIQLGY